MRNLLALGAAALLAVAGLGWYLGWYQVSDQPAPETGHRRVNIDINSAKIEDDIRRGEDKVHEALQKTQSTRRDSPTSSPSPSGPDRGDPNASTAEPPRSDGDK